jgi:hypothetical protein
MSVPYAQNYKSSSRPPSARTVPGLTAVAGFQTSLSSSLTVPGLTKSSSSVDNGTMGLTVPLTKISSETTTSASSSSSSSSSSASSSAGSSAGNSGSGSGDGSGSGGGSSSAGSNRGNTNGHSSSNDGHSSSKSGSATIAQLVSLVRGSCVAGGRPELLPPYNASVAPRHNGSTEISKALATRPWWRPTPDHEPFHLWWSCGQFDWAALQSRPLHAPRALTNRIRGNGAIVNKDKLAVNLRKYVRAAKLDAATASSLLPLTFVLHVQLTDETKESASNDLKADFELVAFREAAAAAKRRGEGAMWICKCPPLNRGRGIHVFKSAKAAEQFLKKRALASAKNRTWVVQKYLENPLLLSGRKFDIRLLVLLTSDSRVFMYRDSYVRTASGEYDAANVKDASIHLVNDAVQAKTEGYGKFEDSNKLSFAELQAVLDAQPLPDGRVLSVDEDVWPAMRSVVSHVFCCALHQHFSPSPPGSAMFELYGLDFMVDDRGKSFLIEVNSGPALCRHGHVLQEMIPRMIEEVVQKAIDPCFPPPAGTPLPTPLDRFEHVDIPPPPTSGAAVNVAAAATAAAAAAPAGPSPSAGSGLLPALHAARRRSSAVSGGGGLRCTF